MKIYFVCCLLFVVSSFSFAQSKYQNKEAKLQQLKTREDIKVTEIEKDLVKLEYTNGKVLYKNIGDYKSDNSYLHRLTYSPTYDSTIIDLNNIDTTLYYQKYSFWQEVPIHNSNFDHLRIGDVNKNGKLELYGTRKLFTSGVEPISVYEFNNAGKFNLIYQYDSVFQARNIYDIDSDGREEVQLNTTGVFAGMLRERFFSKNSDSSLAITKNFQFNPFDENIQIDAPKLGEFDNDKNTDLVFDTQGYPFVWIYEYNPSINNFDFRFRFQVPDPIDLEMEGYSVGDFDLDGKTDIVFGTVEGKVFVIENQGNDQYINVWVDTVKSYNAYVHVWTNDIDKNGKPEFWVLTDAFWSGLGITKIFIFESNGDNSYQVVGRIDLIGVFSFDAGTMQAVDIDNDGVEEVAVCIDDNFLILKFIGSANSHIYETDYIKKNNYEKHEYFYGAIMYDINNDGKYEIFISLYELYEGPPQDIRMFTKAYLKNNESSVINYLLSSKEINLSQNYPNPFNPTTNINFNINKTQNVTIKIYDVLGKEIKTLVNDNLPAGEHDLQWNGKDNEGNPLPSGIYFIQMKAGIYQKTIKTLLLK